MKKEIVLTTAVIDRLFFFAFFVKMNNEFWRLTYLSFSYYCTVYSPPGKFGETFD
jgi:hypothetical protein